MNKALHSSKRMDWETPQAFFDRLNAEFSFTLDAAASEKNAKCRRYYTKELDALSISWTDFGGAIWCNPPYGREIGYWVRKCYAEAQRLNTIIVMLIPARTDTRYWWQTIMRADEIRFVRGRLTFVGAEHPAPFPSVVVVFRRTKRRTPKISTLELP